VGLIYCCQSCTRALWVSTDSQGWYGVTWRSRAHWEQGLMWPNRCSCHRRARCSEFVGKRHKCGLGLQWRGAKSGPEFSGNVYWEVCCYCYLKQFCVCLNLVDLCTILCVRMYIEKSKQFVKANFPGKVCSSWQTPLVTSMPLWSDASLKL